MLFNIHGYGGSPDNSVRRFLRENGDFGAEVVSFDYPPDPGEAYGIMREEVWRATPRERTVVFGTSLGGFFAAALAVDLDVRAVLVNPALRPWDTLRAVDPALTDDTLSRFRPLAHERLPQAEHYNYRKTLVVLGARDDVLDHRIALDYFRRRGSLVLVAPEGGHHGLDLGPFRDAVADIVRWRDLEEIFIEWDPDWAERAGLLD